MNLSRIIIQCRMSSTRLPAKALLPIRGMPSIVLCALRAANRGVDVIVATSADSTDDPLVEALNRAGIRYVRGSLDDVLSRYELAARDLSETDVVVRLTADNLFPDGELALEVAERLVERGLSYLHIGAPEDDLPYGLGAEAFTVKVLRKANDKATSSFDREHVTPWIMREYGSPSFRPSTHFGPMGHMRCTIDEFNDYLNVKRVFDSVQNPIDVSWRELCDTLSKMNGNLNLQVSLRIKNGIQHSTLTLGTAQLGMHYGITNFKGQPSFEQSVDIVRQGIKRGIKSVDCARGYGDAERRIGFALKGVQAESVRVITKLDPLEGIGSEPSTKELCCLVDSSVFRSCRELRMHQLQLLLLHRWKHRTVYDGIIWKRLLELKDEGVIRTLGASVQTPQEALEALEDPDIGHIQLPFNILDWRWKMFGVDKTAMKKKDVVVHSRSALLQGVLTAKSSIWPIVNANQAAEFVSKIDSLVKKCRRESRIDLCIAYVNAQKWIDSIVVGIESLLQLDENIRYFQKSPLSEEQCEIVEDMLRGAPEALLDPSKWMKK